MPNPLESTAGACPCSTEESMQSFVEDSTDNEMTLISFDSNKTPDAPAGAPQPVPLRKRFPRWNSLVNHSSSSSVVDGEPTMPSSKRKLNSVLGTGEQPIFAIPVPKSVSIHKPALPFRTQQWLVPGPEAKLPFSSMMTLELCAGTAGFTAALRRAGFDALGIDHSRNRHSAQAPTAMLDLTTDAGQRVVREVLQSGRLLYCHAAPPCGTASRARDKVVSASLRARGAPSPPPLRSEQWPAGLPNLEGDNLRRVESANKIYNFIAAFMGECHSMGVAWSVENPTRSYMWLMPAFVALIATTRAHFVNYSSCMQGGTRDKQSSWLTCCSQLDSLGVQCDKSHEHESWTWTPDKHFSTADEAAYPRLLCNNAAQSVVDYAISKGHPQPPQALEEARYNHKIPGLQKAFAGKQHRGRKQPALVPEYREIREVLTSVARFSDAKLDKSKLAVEWNSVPSGSKLLRTETIRGDAGTSTSSPNNSIEDSSKVRSFWGIYRTPLEFLAWSKTLKHPRSGSSGLDDVLIKSVFSLLTEGCAATASRRANVFSKWVKRAVALATDEQALHESMSPDVAKLLKGKRLLLFKEMATEAGCKDLDLLHDVCNGFMLTGLSRDTNTFNSRIRLPAMSVEALNSAACWTRRSIIGSTRSSGDKLLDSQLYEETLADREKGWLDGPYTELQLSELLGDDWVVSRRFGIIQSGKLRAIDDLSESFVNSSYGSLESVNLGGIDEVAALSKLFLDIVDDERCVKTILGTGAVLVGKLHASLTLDQARDLVGRTLDLKAAYKQLAINPNSLKHAVLAIHNPVTGQCELFVQKALPFGASASVLSFNRCSRAIYRIGSSLLGLTWTNYFDDFPQVSLKVDASSSKAAAENLCKLLGWTVSEDAKKSVDFSKQFSPLGVVFDYLATSRGSFDVKNKPSRSEEFHTTVQGHVHSKMITAAEAASLKGRFMYADSNVFGRVGRFALALLSARAHSSGSVQILHSELEEALLWLDKWLADSKPRTISRGSAIPPILIFCDGAVEGLRHERVTCGALGYFPTDGVTEAFGMTVEPELLQEWTGGSDKQVIGQAEILPAFVSRIVWENRIRGADVTFFVDNYSALDALVRGYSDATGSRDMLRNIAEHEMSCHTNSWYTRVPSSSNVGDGPSRLDMSLVLDSLNCTIRVAPKFKTFKGSFAAQWRWERSEL